MHQIHHVVLVSLIVVSSLVAPLVADAQQSSSPMPPLPNYMPENSHCFSHSDVAFCVGGDVVSGNTVTAFVSLLAFNPAFQQGPTLEGVVIQGRHAIARVGGYLVLCAGCGSDENRFDDRLYEMDMAFIFRCLVQGSTSKRGCFNRPYRTGIALLAAMPASRSMASITFVPFTGRYAVERGALLIAGGKERSASSPGGKRDALSTVSVAVTIGETHVLLDSVEITTATSVPTTTAPAMTTLSPSGNNTTASASVTTTDVTASTTATTTNPTTPKVPLPPATTTTSVITATPPVATFPDWRHHLLPTEYVVTVLDAGFAAFPMLERVVLFYNVSDGDGGLVVSYIVGKFDRSTGRLDFFGAFPGYLSQIRSSLNHMSNVVIDGHVAYFSTWTGQMWLLDASETAQQGGAAPSRAVQYDVPILVPNNVSSVASIFRSPPGFGITNPSLIIAFIRDPTVPASNRPATQIAAPLYPQVNLQATSWYHYSSSENIVRVHLAIDCYYPSLQNVRVATSPDCSTPFSRETERIPCDVSSGNVDINFVVSEGARDFSICVDKGRCPLVTYGAPNLVTENSAACGSTATGAGVSSCLEQACCVNFDLSLNPTYNCLATMTTTNQSLITNGQLVSEYVPAALNTIEFPVTRTVTLIPPTTSSTTATTTTTTVTSTTTTVTPRPPRPTSTLATTPTSATQNSENGSATTTTAEASLVSETTGSHGQTTIAITTSTTVTTGSPNSNNNNNNNNDDGGSGGGSGLPKSLAIYATGGGIGFIILVALAYVVYKNNGRKCCGKRVGDSDDDDDDDGDDDDVNHKKNNDDGNGIKNKKGKKYQRSGKDEAAAAASSSSSSASAVRNRPKVGGADPMSIIPQFAVVNKIGRGGFGDVYAVRRKTDGEVYALKVYRLQTFHDSSDDDKDNQNFSTLAGGNVLSDALTNGTHNNNNSNNSSDDDESHHEQFSPEQSPILDATSASTTSPREGNLVLARPNQSAYHSSNAPQLDGHQVPAARRTSSSGAMLYTATSTSKTTRAESALSADAFNNHHGSRTAPQIVRVATLQKVGALAFKEQRIMRKLHRETHGRVVKPIEVYVHGNMDGGAAIAAAAASANANAQQAQLLNGNNNNYSNNNNRNAYDDESADPSSFVSNNSQASTTRMPETSINASVAGRSNRSSAINNATNNNNNNNSNSRNRDKKDETTPLLPSAKSTVNDQSRQNSGRGESKLVGNGSFGNFTGTSTSNELVTTDSSNGGGRGSGSGPVPDPQQPIAYAGSIVAGLFELIPGGNFHMYCKSFRDKNKPLPVPTVLRVLAQTADVLHIMAHRSAGVIVHGDIKPENILLRLANGTIALADFGTAVEYRRPTTLAKQTTTSTTTAQHQHQHQHQHQQQNQNQNQQQQHHNTHDHHRPSMGKALSLNYAPPERIQGQALADPALDWWSFGVLIYLTFAPKGRHARSIAMDIARAAKQASTLQQLQPSERQRQPSSTSDEQQPLLSQRPGDAMAELFEDMIREVNEGGDGLPEEIARTVMVGCLALAPEKRMKPNTCRDYLQQFLLEKYFPEHDPKNSNSQQVAKQQQLQQQYHRQDADDYQQGQQNHQNQPLMKIGAGLYDLNIPFVSPP